MTIRTRPLEPADWPKVEAIYREGIATGNATFDAEPPTWDAFNLGKRADLRLVAVDGDAVVGWAVGAPVSARPVYTGVVEDSIYIDESQRGRGIGTALLRAFLDQADLVGVWTVQASVFPENVATLRLHLQAGFRTIGTRERIARMSFGPWAGAWRDTVMMERRSAEHPA